MIIIAGTVEIDPEKREAALAAGRELEAATRRQPGCLAYVWTIDGLSESTICVYERWASEEALAAHFMGPNYNGMRAVLGAFGLRGADVAKYDRHLGARVRRHGDAAAGFLHGNARREPVGSSGPPWPPDRPNRPRRID